MNALTPDPRKRRGRSRGALSAAEKEARKQQWVEENGDTIQDWNEWVVQNGLPLARYRHF
jgi:antitoxin CcdA